jgi:hypothetical protein
MEKGIILLYYIKICISVIGYLSLIYLVYLIILISCIPSCILVATITISLPRADNERRQGELRNSLVLMIFPGFYFTAGKTSRRSHPR